MNEKDIDDHLVNSAYQECHKVAQTRMNMLHRHDQIRSTQGCLKKTNQCMHPGSDLKKNKSS